MSHVSVGELQKLREQTTAPLHGPTPMKAADPDRLAAVLAQAEALAKGRDTAADDAALAAFGEVESVEPKSVSWTLQRLRKSLLS
jgi:hypothetical protein